MSSRKSSLKSQAQGVSRAGRTATRYGRQMRNEPVAERGLKSVVLDARPSEKSDIANSNERPASAPISVSASEIDGWPSVAEADSSFGDRRRRIILLIATASDETLKRVFPAVENAFRTVAEEKRRAAVSPVPGSDTSLSQRRSPNGKPSRLPDLPPNLRWPRRRFSTEFHKRGVGIEQFLTEEWSCLVAAGFGELRWLRMVDPSAAAAVDNYERVVAGTSVRRRLPTSIYFRRERERLDRALLEGMDRVVCDPNLLQTLVFRLRREAASTRR